MTEASPQVQAAPEPSPAPSLEDAAKAVWGDAAAEPAPADVSDAEAKPAEEPAKEEAEPKIAARLTAAKRAEERAAKERAAARAEREQIARAKAEVEARESRIRLLEENPHEYFEGKTDRVKKHLEKLAGTVEPEAVADKKLSAHEERIARLEAENQAYRDRETRQQQEAAWTEAAKVFVDQISENADKYPHLVEEFSDAQATQYAKVMLHEVVGHRDGVAVSRVQAFQEKYGRAPTNEEIATHLDSIAKERIEARSKAAWRKQGDPAPKTSASQAVNGEQAKSPPVKGNSPRTLSSRDTSTRTASQKPWSQEAADEESLRIIEAGWRK
jgi:hypothetical protein